MVFPDAIEAEYREIEKTVFWQKFMIAIHTANAQSIRDLCSARPEDVQKLQGRIFAYDKVIGLPDKVVKDSKGITATAPDGTQVIV